ncbi:MAG: hypothetical protein ACKOCI_10645, partial [Cyanobium sp.]
MPFDRLQGDAMQLGIAFLSVFAALLALVAVQGAIRGWWWRQARLVLEKLPLKGVPQLHRIALQAIERQL